MPTYRYKAMTSGGRRVRGVRTAGDESDLWRLLKKENKYLISSKELSKRKRFRQLDSKTLTEYCRQMSVLLSAGIPLAKALFILAQDEHTRPATRKVYSEVLRLIRQGDSLSDAMEQQGEAFPVLLVQMFRASELSGSLDQTAKRMADYYEKEHRLNAQIRSATAYPKFLCILIAAALTVLIGYVLPQFQPLFEILDELPVSTRILYQVTGYTKQYGFWIVSGIVGLIWFMRTLGRVGPVRLFLDHLKLRLPLFGDWMKTIYSARFCRSFSSLYSAGIPALAAMEAAKKTVGNAWIQRQLDQSAALLRSGESLSKVLEDVEGFVGRMPSVIRVGEEAGSLEQMLNSMAENLEYESETVMTKMVAFLEPALIILAAVLVGFIMIAVMTPIYSSYMAMESAAY